MPFKDQEYYIILSIEDKDGNVKKDITLTGFLDYKKADKYFYEMLSHGGEAFTRATHSD